MFRSLRNVALPLCVASTAFAQLPTNDPPTFGAVGVSVYSGDVERRIALIQSALGVGDISFRFYIPIDAKLIISFVVTTDGQVDKEVSRTYQIKFSPEDYKEQAFLSMRRDPPSGFITIWEKKDDKADLVTWSFRLSPQSNFEFRMPKRVFEGAGSVAMTQMPGQKLEFDKDYEALAYDVSRTEAPAGKFSLRMIVRATKRMTNDAAGVAEVKGNN
jgi:hypothetical protein